MGYQEVLCQICGVSFNINRIRTPNEPRSAAWGGYGHSLDNCEHWTTPWHGPPSFVQHFQHRYADGWGSARCSCDTGCLWVNRKIKDEGKVFAGDARGTPVPPKEEEDDEMDEDWIEDDAEEEDEPLEYCSDEEKLRAEEDPRNPDVEMQDSSNDETQAPAVKEQIRQSWLRALTLYPQGRRNLWSSDDVDGRPAWYRGYPLHVPLYAGRDIIDDMHQLPPPKPKQVRKATGGIPPRKKMAPQKPEAGSPKRVTMSTRVAISTEPAPQLSSASKDQSFTEPVGTGENSKSAVDYHAWTWLETISEEDKRYSEHIAGPECQNLNGYSGHEASAEEMRGCETSQCLVRKPKGWVFHPQSDDEDFEKNGQFFLSGLSDWMPEAQDGGPQVRPQRHGCDRPNAVNVMWQADEAHNYAMPFHPSCLEVFKRASQAQNGFVDMVGLTSWYALDADYGTLFGQRNWHASSYAFPRHPDVRKCEKSQWEHHPGTAYLATNPLHVPMLRGIFEAATGSDPRDKTRNGAFDVPGEASFGTNSDPFTLLPYELNLEILGNLRSRDIASLRLSSRAFRQLPVAFFQKLLNREMPWLWEAWPTPTDPSIGRTPYAYWAIVSQAEAEDTLNRYKGGLAGLEDYIQIVAKEMPELEGDLQEALPAALQEVEEAYAIAVKGRNDLHPFFLPPDRTNYFILYTLLTRHWQQLRGLRNRARIWEDCQEILRRVDVYREEGRIGPDGNTESLHDIIERNQKRDRDTRERQRRERGV